MHADIDRDRDDSGARRRSLARSVGFSADTLPEASFRAKDGSHDDGPGHGMFLGAIGGPVFSRDLLGRFSRWHLQPGMHFVTELDAAFLMVHWRDDAGDHSRVLRRDDVDRHEISVLFPVSHETFAADEMPFVVHLAAFSPVVGGTEHDAGLPVVVFDVTVESVDGGDDLPAVDVALFWPNLNGWRASAVTTADRGDQTWPGHHHAGNVNVDAADSGMPAGAYVLQRRELAVNETRDTVGEICLGVSGDAGSYSRQVQFMTHQHATDVPDHEQPYTLAAVRHAFATTGRLGAVPDDSWRAHWHEPVGSAVAAHHAPGGERALTRFVLAFDWPYVTFGEGRSWHRRYAAVRQRAGARGPDALALTRHAYEHADGWLAGIDAWHDGTVRTLTGRGWSEQVAGAVVNEYGLVTSLGTAWLDGTPDGHEPDTPLDRSEHVGLLEGFDMGYFYYDTEDLWHYAFPALSVTWPRLGSVVFADYVDALAAVDDRRRPVYRVGEPRQMLVADKVPHDLGNPMEDPFVQLNGYVTRDDPNTWRDANPAFVLAALVHARLCGEPVDDATWQRLRAAAEVTDRQDAEGAGVPRHDEFGDNTWDALQFRGYSTYTASLCAGMWAAMAHESRQRGEDPTWYDERLDRARSVLDMLWNGEYFRANSEGRFERAVMPDSVFGLFYADLLGAGDVVDPERLRSHLRAGYRIAHLGYAEGRVGPLLIAEPGHGQDAGDRSQMQASEVLVGAAWMFAAMLRHYGLPAEADDVAGTLRNVLYGGTGLQFRTPAAVDAFGRFRAPLNMRPLAAWWLAAAPERGTGGQRAASSALERAGGHAGDEVALQQHVGDHHRQRRDDHAGEQQRVLGEELTGERQQRQRQRPLAR